MGTQVIGTHLHSTVVLLKDKLNIDPRDIFYHLHSTVVLLKVKKEKEGLEKQNDLHSTVVLLKVKLSTSPKTRLTCIYILL